MNWYEYQPIFDFQQKFDFASFPVQGVDIPMPNATRITSLFDGTIENVYYDAGGGQLVIKIDNPSLSRGIPYFGFAHFDAYDPAFKIGTKVKAGQFLGFSGGQNVGQPVNDLPVGYTHHYAAPNYSNGAHIELFLSKSPTIPYLPEQITDDLNPYWLLDYAKQVNIGTANPSGSNNVSENTKLGVQSPAIKQIAFNKIDEKSSTGDILKNVDLSLSIVDPFLINAKSINIVGITMSDPVDWMTQFGINLMFDFRGLILRLIIISLGIVILYFVISDYLEIGLIPSKSKEVAKNAAKSIVSGGPV